MSNLQVFLLSAIVMSTSATCFAQEEAWADEETREEAREAPLPPVDWPGIPTLFLISWWIVTVSVGVLPFLPRRRVVDILKGRIAKIKTELALDFPVEIKSLGGKEALESLHLDPLALPLLARDFELVDYYAEQKRIVAGWCALLLPGLGVHRLILGRICALSLNITIVVMVGVAGLAYAAWPGATARYGTGFILFCSILLLIGMGLVGLIEGVKYLRMDNDKFFEKHIVGGREWF